MGKVGTYKIKEGDMAFSYEVSVTSDGHFTTTIPKNVVEVLVAANVTLYQNRNKTLGYFTDRTLDGLQAQVKGVIQEYQSRELIEEKIVIRYQIRTTCSYCLDLDGNPVPNGQFRWTGTEDYSWKDGTRMTHSASREPFGLLLWLDVATRRDYLYRSGAKKTEYESRGWNDFEDAEKPNLDYLASIRSIATIQGEEVHEIDYTEPVAAVFVGMLKSIFMMNERIKEWTTPEKIAALAESKTKLLG